MESNNNKSKTFKIETTENAPLTPTGRVWEEYKTADNKHDAFTAWNAVRFAGHNDVQAVRIMLDSTVIALDGHGERGFILDCWK